MKLKLLFGSVILSILLLTCNKDGGVEPTPQPKIEGSITFSGTWPQTPEEVRVVVGSDFPINNFNDLKMGDNLAGDGSVNYSINVESGDYKFVGVAWKPAGGVWGLASICGVHTMNTGFNAPALVSVSSNKSTTGINIQVNRSQAKTLTDAKIVGTVNLQGAWPDSFSSAMVISSARDLISEPFDLLDLNMGTAIERGQTSADYIISTPAGTNRTTGIAFLDKDGILTQEAVYFSQNNGGLEINEQNISDNETVTGPNFEMTLGSVTSAIQGTISFTGEWPATAEEVRLITATVYPPTMDELIIGEAISANASSHKYTFYLQPDTYKMVGVAWRAEGTTWDVMSICGAYFAGKDSLAPSPVVIPDDSIVKDINIVVNRSKARKVTETYIQGQLTFSGTWPANFTEARVIATTKFQIFPTILPTMLDLTFSAPIAVGTTSTDYQIKAFPGTFAAIGVIFLKADEELTIDDILYSLDVNGLSLEPFEVAENTIVTGPNFDVQF